MSPSRMSFLLGNLGVGHPLSPPPTRPKPSRPRGQGPDWARVRHPPFLSTPKRPLSKKDGGTIQCVCLPVCVYMCVGQRVALVTNPKAQSHLQISFLSFRCRISNLPQECSKWQHDVTPSKFLLIEPGPHPEWPFPGGRGCHFSPSCLVLCTHKAS